MNTERFLRWFAFAYSGIFFSSIPIYAGLYVWAYQPIHFIVVALLILSFMTLMPGALTVRIDVPIIKWAFSYMAVCFFWYAMFGGGDTEPLRKRILGAIFLIMSYTLFSQSNATVRVARFAVLCCVLIGAVIYVYDISHPFTFVPASSELANPGRAAGLYVNANHAAAAMVLGYVLTIGLVPERWKVLFTYIAFGATILTVSRAGILAFAVVLVLLVFSRLMSVRGAVVAVALLTGTGYLIIRVVQNLFPGLHLDTSRLIERAAWFLDPTQQVDLSQSDRTTIVAETWARIAQHPYLGNGFGYTESRISDIPTHDLYILLMSDFGLWGCLLVPAFAWACVSSARGESGRLRFPFVSLILIIALFDHGPFVSYYFLTASALMAAISDRSSALNELAAPAGVLRTA
jgi:O-antigen ligase